jgi:hypothetical protein
MKLLTLTCCTVGACATTAGAAWCFVSGDLAAAVTFTLSAALACGCAVATARR